MNRRLKTLTVLVVGVLCLMFWHQAIEASTTVGFFTANDGYLYYADEQGVTVKNAAVEHKGSTYFASTSGRIFQNTLVYWNGKRFVQNPKEKGFGKVKDAYIVDKNGKAYQNRAVKYNNKVYIASNDKKLFRKTFVYYDGKKYGSKVKSVGKLKATYYVNANGCRLDKAQIKLNGKYYYTRKTGKLYREAIFTFKSKKYYVNKNGVGVPNVWVTRGKSLYRTKAKGEIRANQTYKQSRVRYTIAKNGKVVNTVMSVDELSQRGDLTSFGNSTISQYGCGVVSTTMAMRYLTGREISVREMRDIANPYYDLADAYTNGKLHDGFFGHVAKVYGKKSKITTNGAEALAAAKKGCAVLSFQRRPSIFAYYGHYIIIKAVNSKNQVRVNDPSDTAKKNHNNRTFDFYRDVNKSSVKYVIFYK